MGLGVNVCQEPAQVVKVKSSRMHQHSALVYIQISEYDFKILSSHGVHESAFAKPSLSHHHQRELKPPLHRLSVHLSTRKGLKLIDLRSFWSINKAGHLIGKVCKTNIAIKLSRRFSHWLALRRDNSLKLESWLCDQRILPQVSATHPWVWGKVLVSWDQNVNPPR